MGYFIRGTGSDLTPLQHSLDIFKQYILGNYFSTMTGKRGSGKPIIIDDTMFRGKDKGDTARYHFIPQNFGDGIEGQNASIIGNEDSLDEYFMDLRIDQIAKAFKRKGKMTDIRTIWDFRNEAKSQLANWFKWRTENDMVDALTGIITDGASRLTDAEILTEPLVNGNGRCIRPDYASNKFTTVEISGANSTTTALLTAMNATDIMNTQILDELQDFAKTANSKYAMSPIRVKDGEEYYILVLHPRAATSLRQDTRWEKRAVAGMTGNMALQNDPIATGAIGVWEKIIIKEANFIRTHSNADGSVRIARNLLLGAEAAVMAYAQNLDYCEELFDYNRIMGVSADEIRGFKKLQFDGVDLNVAQVPCAIKA